MNKTDKNKISAAHKEHANITYLKQDDIGLVISKGMAVLYKEHPKNPVDYLAKWLLNYAGQKDLEKEVCLKYFNFQVHRCKRKKNTKRC
jgi:hypothetical protein